MGLRHIFDSHRYASRVRAPSFNTQGWDDSRSNLWSGYAYALNLPEIGNAQPGALEGRLKGFLNEAASLQDKLLADGHTHRTQNTPFDPASQYVIAAFDFDGHSIKGQPVLVRLDNTGRWSVKPEGQTPRDVDLDQNPITDPLKARLLGSSLNHIEDNCRAFKGFFLVNPSIRYAPRMDAPFSLVRTHLETNAPMQVTHVHVGIRDIA